MAYKKLIRVESLKKILIRADIFNENTFFSFVNVIVDVFVCCSLDLYPIVY